MTPKTKTTSSSGKLTLKPKITFQITFLSFLEGRVAIKSTALQSGIFYCLNSKARLSFFAH
jgi:hypothetical protein